MQNNQSKMVLRLTESGILLAVGILLDTFLKFDAPWAYGGSITFFSMLPLIIIAYKYGVAWGSLAGLAHGLITMLISGGRAGGLAAMIEDNGGLTIFLWIMLFDYILAFAIIGLAGFAPRCCKTAPFALVWGSVIGLLGRYLMHTISGFLFFGDYAEWFFTEAATGLKFIYDGLNGSGKLLAFVYSLIYNGLYMIPEIIITAVGGFLVAKLIPQVLSKNRTNAPLKGSKSAK